MGGGFALLLVSGHGFSAASINYGGKLPPDVDDFLKTACPVVGSYGAKSRWEKGVSWVVQSPSEKRPTVPGTPQTRKELVEELKFLSDQENILELISGWGQAMQHVQSTRADAETFLLLLDPTNRELKVIPYKKDEQTLAQEEYLLARRQATPECR